MKPNLTPRAVVALSTAGVSLFLLICFAGYGPGDALAVRGETGLADRVASWLVTPLGAGAYVIAVLGFVWGVVVYFQERTPDLVLRLVGTTTLAASVAMIAGLAQGGEHSLWTGTVGAASAHALVSMGLFGKLLGWVAALGLCGVSAIFATDWLFHSVRRGSRPAFDARTIPTEPSRGDLLGDPAEAEPREFVRTESRAAAHVPEIRAEAPAPVEPVVASVPEGFTAVKTGGRTFVKGPSGYEGVQFLPPSDNLATPEPPRAGDVHHGFAGVIDDDLDFAPTDDDPVSFARAEDTAEIAVGLGDEDEEGPEDEAPTTGSPDVARADHFADGIPDEAPRSGIALADASLLVDEVFTFPAVFADEADDPNDGASAAAEIASTLAPPTHEVAPASDDEPAPAAPPQPWVETQDLPEDAESVHAEPVPAETAAPVPAPEDGGDSDANAEADDAADDADTLFVDDVVFAGRSFLAEDEVFVFDERPGLVPTPPSFAEAAHASLESSSAVAVAELAAPIVGLAPAPTVVDDTTGSISVTPEEIAAIRERSVVASPDALPAESLAAPAPGEPAVLASSMGRAPEPATTEEEYDEVAAEEPTTPVVLAPAAEAPAVPEAAVEAEAVVEAAVEAAPAVEAEPVAAPPAVEAPAPAAEVSVAPEAPESAPAETPAAAAPAAQLKLFAAPACDLTKLAAMELDPLFHDAAAAVLTRGRASAVVLQRALGIGYARGLRILDQMTEAGMLGPDSPGGAREICFTSEQWDAWQGRV